jgi:hypothetical protein
MRGKTSQTPYQVCTGLFGTYPETIGDAPGDMVLIVPGGSAYTVVRHEDTFTVCEWQRNAGVAITPATRDIPAECAHALAHGIPYPRDGALYGWVTGMTVTAIIAFYADPDEPEPVLWTMPRAGSDVSQWPPFTTEPGFGAWFWEHRTAGQVIPLGDLITASAGRVFWSGLPTTDSSAGIIGVRGPLPVPGRYWLEAGVYACHASLRRGAPVPSLEEVLADADKAGFVPGDLQPAGR